MTFAPAAAIEPSDEQRIAGRRADRHFFRPDGPQVFRLEGRGGTGKTMTAVAAALRADAVCLALTNRAVANLIAKETLK